MPFKLLLLQLKFSKLVNPDKFSVVKLFETIESFLKLDRPFIYKSNRELLLQFNSTIEFKLTRFKLFNKLLEQSNFFNVLKLKIPDKSIMLELGTFKLSIT